MAEVIIHTKYKCTQQELYGISDSMITSLTAHMAPFTAMKPTKYVAGFPAALQLQRTNTMALLDDDQRTALHEIQRARLVILADKCIYDFKVLRTYINDGFPIGERHAQYVSAGQNNFKKAINENWEEVTGMNTKMNAYLAIAANVTALTTGHMQTGFAALVTADTLAFQTSLTAFMGTRHTGTATGDKIKANNLLYDAMIDLHTDAVVAIEGDLELLKEFTFSDVKNLISPPGSASLEVELMKVVANTPVDGTITIQKEGGIAIVLPTTDAVAKFAHIDPARYHVHVVVAGSPDVDVFKDVNTGVNARLKLTIE